MWTEAPHAQVLVMCRSGDVEGATVYRGVDVTDAAACQAVAAKMVLDGGPIDVVINNAGYFYGPCEKVTEGSLNFEEELKQIDICAVGPLRVTNALYKVKSYHFTTLPFYHFYHFTILPFLPFLLFTI